MRLVVATEPVRCRTAESPLPCVTPDWTLHRELPDSWYVKVERQVWRATCATGRGVLWTVKAIPVAVVVVFRLAMAAFVLAVLAGVVMVVIDVVKAVSRWLA